MLRVVGKADMVIPERISNKGAIVGIYYCFY